MKKIFLLFLLIIIFSGCKDAFNTEPEESNSYYLSVRIVDKGTEEPLKGHMVGIYVNESLKLNTTTDNNGWVGYTGGLQESDFVRLNIYSKDNSLFVKTTSFTPRNYPGMFVKKKSDLRTNVPSGGYHLWTSGLL